MTSELALQKTVASNPSLADSLLEPTPLTHDSLHGDTSHVVVARERELLELLLQDEQATSSPITAGPNKPSNSGGGSPRENSPQRGAPSSPVPTPELDKWGRDLTKQAAEGGTDPVLNREEELRALVQTLTRRMKNNPVLIGEPGVGKTAVVEELAYRIQAGLIPELEGKRIVSLEVGSLLAGTQLRGSFEEKLKNVMKEVKKAGNVILFIDEIHTVVSSGSSEGGLNIGNMLKPDLARGEVQVIGATTITEYRQHIEKDGALERRFKPIILREPQPDATLQILDGVKDLYESHHKVYYSPEAIVAAVRYSNRYIGDRYQPDKSIDLIDEAGTRLRLQRYNDPSVAPVVTERHIAEVVSAMTGQPVGSIMADRSDLVKELPDQMKDRILGQDEVIEAFARAEMREAAGMRDPRRPYVCYFMGPTGVGKTYSAQVFAELTGRPLIRIDMSEFMESHSVSKLIGAPPGYIGYDEPGKLTEQIRRYPSAVVLFDEFDKAHPDIQKVLLQMMDDGRLTDAKGRHINCANLVVVMTSNVKSEEQTKRSMGFGMPEIEAAATPSAEEARGRVQKTLLAAGYAPEFLNRIDSIGVFKNLTHEDKLAITRKAIDEIGDLAEKSHGVALEVTPRAIEHIAAEGFDARYGARSVRRAVVALVADPLSDAILRGTVGENEKVTLDYDGKGLKFVR